MPECNNITQNESRRDCRVGTIEGETGTIPQVQPETILQRMNANFQGWTPGLSRKELRSDNKRKSIPI